MVPVISQATEANPEDMNMDIEGTVEEDTGLTQQLRTVNPSPLREVPGTDQQGADAWPWSDDDEVSNPEYPEQQDVFLRKPRCGRPPGVKLKNTARVRLEEPIADPKFRGEVNIVDEFSSQPGVWGALPEKDKTCEPTSDVILLSK